MPSYSCSFSQFLCGHGTSSHHFISFPLHLHTHTHTHQHKQTKTHTRSHAHQLLTPRKLLFILFIFLNFLFLYSNIFNRFAATIITLRASFFSYSSVFCFHFSRHLLYVINFDVVFSTLLLLLLLFLLPVLFGLSNSVRHIKTHSTHTKECLNIFFRVIINILEYGRSYFFIMLVSLCGIIC